MAGGIATVKVLLTGDVIPIGVTRDQIGAMGIQEGKLVYIVNNKIVAVANTLAETRIGIPTYSKGQSETELQQTQTIQRRTVVQPEPVVQPKPQPKEKPVRALW